MEMALVTILVELARACTLSGDPARALEVLDEADKLTWSPVHEYQPDLHLQRAVAAAALDDRLTLEAAAERAAALAHNTGSLAGLTVAETASGLLAQADGRRGDAVTAFERAARLSEQATRWTWAADRWCDAAAAADPSRRKPYLERAAELAATHGLDRVAARVQAIGPGGPDAWLDPGPLAQLTERELDVVRIVATGRTNKQVAAELYLSELTVRNYLSTAMAKLGVHRRTELAALLAGLL
jgi:DNA-binding CsgD family transcriptional regulator